MNNSTAPDNSAPSPALTIDELLTDLASSGKSTAAFARERGVPSWKLYNALRKRDGRRRKARSSSALVPVVVSDQRNFEAVPLELKLSSGHRLLVPANFDEGALRRLMGVLAGC